MPSMTNRHKGLGLKRIYTHGFSSGFYEGLQQFFVVVPEVQRTYISRLVQFALDSHVISRMKKYSLVFWFNNRLAKLYPYKCTVPSSIQTKMPHIQLMYKHVYAPSRCTNPMMPSHFSEKIKPRSVVKKKASKSLQFGFSLACVFIVH